MPRPKQPLIKPAEAVAKALEVIDRDGLDGFNLRLLAQELGVNPSSLYHHFHDKNEHPEPRLSSGARRESRVRANAGR